MKNLRKLFEAHYSDKMLDTELHATLNKHKKSLEYFDALKFTFDKRFPLLEINDLSVITGYGFITDRAFNEILTAISLFASKHNITVVLSSRSTITPKVQRFKHFFTANGFAAAKGANKVEFKNDDYMKQYTFARQIDRIRQAQKEHLHRTEEV